MTKRVSLLFLFLILVLLSCGKKNAQSSAGLLIEKEEAETVFDVQPVMIGFTQKQEEKVRKASELIRRVVNSEEFRKKVLNYKFNGKRTFNDNRGLTNRQIYKKILEGSEKMTGLGKNGTMDLELELYTDRESTTIGYTYPNIVRVYMNRKYFNRFRPYQVADNMMHEWLHKIGFDHEVKATPDRRHSVPYAIGYIVKDLAKKFE